jgi:hypothetical protein
MIAYFFTKPLDFDYQLLYSNRIGAQVLNLFLFYQKKRTKSLFLDSGKQLFYGTILFWIPTLF